MEIKYRYTADFGQTDKFSQLIGITRHRWMKLSLLTWKSSYIYAKFSGGLNSEHSVTTDVIRHESAKNSVIRKAMN